MAGNEGKFKPHFILGGRAENELFERPPFSVNNPGIPEQNRDQHGAMLLGQFADIAPRFDDAREIKREAGIGESYGLRLTFESFPDIKLAFEKLATERSGIELLNVRHVDGRSFATIFVPDGKLHVLENKLRAYLDESRDGSSGPKNRKLWDTVAAIRETALEHLWADSADVFPASDNEAIWWEAWLPVRGNRDAVVHDFRRLAREQGFRLTEGVLGFPERSVVLAYGTVAQMRASLLILNSVAALRRAKETAEFFDGLPLDEQPDWVDDTLHRMQFPDGEGDVPYVCLLDTGVNHAHPLLQPALCDDDKHTVDPNWGTHDSAGHGTNMAGLALLGDLTPILAATDPVHIGHRLESVKLLPHGDANHGSARHHGYLTVEAVARPNVGAPNRAGVFSMAVTADDHRDNGLPSAWSSAVDRIASDADAMGEKPRLVVISAGNTPPDVWNNYPKGIRKMASTTPDRVGMH